MGEAPLWRVWKPDEDKLRVTATDMSEVTAGTLTQYRPVSDEVCQHLEEISFYHANLNRHVAESLLLQNGTDGTYLLRPSSKNGEIALSVRCRDSVKHFPVKWDGVHFYFGLEKFPSLTDLIRHFLTKPLLGSESGTLTGLKHPYPKEVEEPVYYDTVKVHATMRQCSAESGETSPNFSVASKEGFLTKQGKIVKNWKIRFFTLHKNKLSYYRDKNDKEPIRILDLLECVECARDYTLDKDFCFSLEFPYRTFFMYAATKQEMTEWMKIIRWKLKHKDLIQKTNDDEKILESSEPVPLRKKKPAQTNRQWYIGTGESSSLSSISDT